MPSPFQRQLTQKQLAKLERVAGPDGAGWRTQDFDNAVIIAVDPRLLDDTSLTAHPYGPYRRITWHPGAAQETMVLVAGAHRQAISTKLTELHRQSIASYEEAIAKLNPEYHSETIQEHRDHIAKLTAACVDWPRSG